MAVLSYSGVLLASRAEERDENEYEEDELDDDVLGADLEKRKKSSNIQFKPFSSTGASKEWSYELKNRESVECLAMGSRWCAVLTTNNYLRVFSTDGIQKHLLCLATPVVSMAGYENLLAVVSHAGLPIYGC
jgi:hypothetical protein